jgi:quercetin dioxygenase-like cupin family protein
MIVRLLAIAGLLSLAATSASAQEVHKRIISRADLTGTNMEVILVETEVPPGATSARHTHPGEEAYYVIQGTTTQMPGQAPVERKVGTGGINKRDVPHAGYKNVGTQSLKLVNVYIVDKGKPLSSFVK